MRGLKRLSESRFSVIFPHQSSPPELLETADAACGLRASQALCLSRRRSVRRSSSVQADGRWFRCDLKIVKHFMLAYMLVKTIIQSREAQEWE
jgi:hypothetical protein